jgi:hypothetical protein
MEDCRMSTRTRGVLSAALALIAAANAFGAPPASEPKWNQKEVLALGEKLVTALHDAEAAAREAPPQATALQQRKRDAAVSTFLEVRQAADVYVTKLRAGWDGDRTEAYFRNVRDGLRRALDSARDAVPSEKVGENLGKANQALAELARYYPNV